jgi:teichuronic acid biosynthesis glycosyltransferase TuaC
MTARYLANQFLGILDRHKLVSWETQDNDANVLMITNAWPHSERPTYAPFIKYTVDGLRAHGVRSDVLFIRGYKGLHSYILGCLAVAVLPIARPGKYRLIHAHGGETALVARCFFGAPVVASYLGTDILAPRQGSRKTQLKCWLRSKVLRLHSVFLTSSTTKTREMESFLPARAQSNNHVIPDGVDLSRFQPLARNEARRQTDWPSTEITVIAVGRRVPLKRLWLAEQAALKAAETVPDLHLRILSDVAPQDMPLQYCAADCLIHTSASEGSPNVIKEALACDLPIVATPAGDIPELLTDVHPSAVCEPNPEDLAAALIRCATRVRSNGRTRVQHLGTEMIAQRVLEWYRSLDVELGITQ